MWFLATHHVFTHRISSVDPQTYKIIGQINTQKCIRVHTNTHTRPVPAVLDAAQAYACPFIHTVRTAFLLPRGTGR